MGMVFQSSCMKQSNRTLTIAKLEEITIKGARLRMCAPKMPPLWSHSQRLVKSNLGLREMAEAKSTHDYWQPLHLAVACRERRNGPGASDRGCCAGEVANVPTLGGIGTTASSDGQFLPSARQDEAVNMVSAIFKAARLLQSCFVR